MQDFEDLNILFRSLIIFFKFRGMGGGWRLVNKCLHQASVVLDSLCSHAVY